jgi:hypothetical protein
MYIYYNQNKERNSSIDCVINWLGDLDKTTDLPQVTDKKVDQIEMWSTPHDSWESKWQH